VFHAGDGNLHPLILFDANQPGEMKRPRISAPTSSSCAWKWAAPSPASTASAWRSWTPPAASSRRRSWPSSTPSRPPSTRNGLLNPGKAVPTLHRCAELGRMRVSGGAVAVSRIAEVLMEAEFIERVKRAAADRTPLCIRGGGSKAFYGRHCDGELLDVSGHRGIVSYEPSELVITARAGTPLADIEAALAYNGQLLPFEPPHFGPGATLGGMVAAGLSGPRRPWGGSVRDAVLGVKLLNGRGEVLRFGGQVMKNVAGYDLSRLMAGALGTLGVLLEVSVKVLPRPAEERTRMFELSAEAAAARQLEWGPAASVPECHPVHGGRLYVRLCGSTQGVAAGLEVLGGEADGGCALAGRAGADPALLPGRGAALAHLPARRRARPEPARRQPDRVGRGPALAAHGPARRIGAPAGRRPGWPRHPVPGSRWPGRGVPAPGPGSGGPAQAVKQALDPHGIFNRGRIYEGL
jgi:glycolate oxidase FAD binding subunit